MESICRGCLTIEERDVNTLHFTEKDRRQFLYASGIQIKEKEAATFRLCRDCQENMKTSCKFKKTSRNSYKLFQTYLAVREDGCNMDFSTYIKNEENLYGFRFYNDAECSNGSKDDDQLDNVSANTNLLNFVTTMIKEDRSMSPIHNGPPEPELLDDTMDTQWLQDDNAMTLDFPLNFSQLNTPRSQVNGFASTPRHQTQMSDKLKIGNQCVIDNNLLRAINNNKDMCNIEDILRTPKLDTSLPQPMHFSDKEIEFSIGNNLNNSSQQMYKTFEDNYNEEFPNPKGSFKKPRKSAPRKNMAKMKRYCIEDVNRHELNSSHDTIPDPDDKLNVSKGSCNDDEGIFKIPKEYPNSKEIFIKPRKNAPRKNMDKFKRYIEDDNEREINYSDDTIPGADQLNIKKESNDEDVFIKSEDAVEGNCRMTTEMYHHLSKDDFKCNKCDFTVQSKKLFVQHCSDEHNIDMVVKVKYSRSKISCEVCGKFILSTNVGYHMKSHEVDEKAIEETTTCKICKLKFQNNTKLKIHMNTHEKKFGNKQEEIKDSQIYKYACPKCPYRAKTTSNLNVHLRRHEKRFKYICRECGKGHIRKGDLDRHYRVHSGDKPFKCPHCPSSFPRLDHLNLHIRDHTGERPYVCDTCDEKFKQCGDLTYHKRYVCPR